jgi:NTP pyrophosphatase (non-canonical NTP hydrolase)
VTTMSNTDLSHSFYLLALDCADDSKYWFPDIWEKPTGPTIHFALGLAGEVGELINLLKKANRKGDATKVDKEAAEKEIADIFIYLVDLAHSLGINVWDAYGVKHAELEERWGKRPV